MVIWDVLIGQRLCTIPFSSCIATGALFSTRRLISSTGCLLATFSEQNVELWDIRSGVFCGTLYGSADGTDIAVVEFSPDGSQLVSGDNNGTIQLWDLSTRTPIARTSLHSDAIKGLTFSPDGSQLTLMCEDGYLYFWNLQSAASGATTRRRITAPGHFNQFLFVFSPSGEWLASTSDDTDNVIIWHPSSGGLFRPLSLPKFSDDLSRDVVLSVAWSSDERLIACATMRNIYVWDIISLGIVVTEHDMSSWSGGGGRLFRKIRHEALLG